MNFPFQKGIHLQKNEIYFFKNKCPICLKSKKRQVLLKIQEKPNVDLLLCTYCKGASASYLPKVKTLKRCYSFYYRKDDEVEPKVTFHNPERFAKHLVKYAQFSKQKNKISILDFGGGDGALSKAVAEHLRRFNRAIVFEIVVVDYLVSQDSFADNVKIRFIKNLDSLHSKFDIVIASGVVEHIPEVNTTLKKLFDLMAKDGYFYARTPLVAPFKRYVKSVDFCYPFHVHDLGASFWNRIIETFSLKSTKIVISQPAISETEFRKNFLFTAMSYFFKAPAFLELQLFKKKNDMLWNFYSSWEIILHHI